MSVLDEAKEICEGSRQEAYGHPYDNYKILKPIWEGILGIELSYAQIAFCMMGLKMARYLENSNRDSLVDIPGYAWVLEKVEERAREEADRTPA